MKENRSCRLSERSVVNHQRACGRTKFTLSHKEKMPLLFCLGLHPAFAVQQDQKSERLCAFLDDLHIICRLERGPCTTFSGRICGSMLACLFTQGNEGVEP